MRAPLAFAATCTAVSAVLLLSACGGGSGDGNDKITKTSSTPPPSPSATATSASPSSSPSADGVKRPTITLPSDAKDVFEDQRSGDPVKDAILADNAAFVLAMDEGIFKGKTTSDLGFYATGRGLTNAIDYVKGVNDKDLVWTGTVRYFDRRVTMEGTDEASVVYCSDESKAFPKHVKTGKVDNVATTARSYVLYSTHAKKSAQGVWQTTDITSQRGAKQCQP